MDDLKRSMPKISTTWAMVYLSTPWGDNPIAIFRDEHQANNWLLSYVPEGIMRFYKVKMVRHVSFEAIHEEQS